MRMSPADTSGRFLGQWWTKRVGLLEGEVPLEGWNVNYLHSLGWLLQGWGVLYLTNNRLVWVPGRLLFGSRPTQIPLEEIAASGVKRSFWTSFLRSLVIGTRDGQNWWFVPMRGQPRAEEMARVITSILRERGLLRD